MKKITTPVLTLSIATFLMALSSFAAEKKTEPKAPSKEQRQQMAVAHQKMADCLKSDKPISECRSEMMKNCHDMMGKEGCSMMMGSMQGKSGHGGMMGSGMMGEDHETQKNE